MKRWRDLVLIVALFALLIGFTVFGPGRNRAEAQGQPGSARSAADDGALALQRWLEQLGYRTRNLEYAAWSIPDDADALLVIGPTQEAFTAAEADETLRWVHEGGTLVLLTPTPSLLMARNSLLDALGARIVVPDHAQPAPTAEAVQPVLVSPPVGRVPAQSNAALELDRDDWAPLLRTTNGDSLVGIQEGSGYVYLGSMPFPLTNAGLRETGSGALALNMLARIPPGGSVWFDEYHHGYRDPQTLRSVALRQGWGWAVLYTLLVVVLYIVLTGRRFGRPIPLRADVTRRSSAEYVQSLAMLLRRGGKREYALRHYHGALKRRLARPYGFAPSEDDLAFVVELERRRALDDEQAARLRTLLLRLRNARGDEELVRLVREADAFADGKGRAR